LPALGYSVFQIRKANNELAEYEKVKFGSCGSIMHYKQKIEFVNGRIDLINDGKRIKNIVSLVDFPNDGDNYDSSPYKGMQEQSLPLNSACVHTGLQNDKLEIHGSASLPLELADHDSNSPQYGKLTYTLQMQFNEKGQIIVHLSLDNQVNSHRLRLCFAPQIQTDEVLAQIQAGYVKTKNETIEEHWPDEFVEKPVNLYNFDKSVSLMEDAKHFTFFGAGQKEYEYHDHKLFITLMATTGQLGKPNLEWRPGRASGDTTSQGHVMMSTPLAQERGKNEFDFAFKLTTDKFSSSENNILTREWLSPDVSYQNQSLNVFINRLDNKIWETENTPEIPTKLEILSISRELNVSALYPAYSSSDEYILRLQNLSSIQQEISNELLAKSQVVNALEEPITQTSIKPYDLLSLKIKLD